MSDEQAAIGKLYAENVTALNARDVSALAAFYTENAMQLPPNAPPLVGRDAIRASLESELHGLDVAAEVEIVETIVSGAWAVARGTYRTVVTPAGGGRTTAVSGNWLDVLERQPDGSWKIARSTWTGEGSEPAQR